MTVTSHYPSAVLSSPNTEIEKLYIFIMSRIHALLYRSALKDARKQGMTDLFFSLNFKFVSRIHSINRFMIIKNR